MRKNVLSVFFKEIIYCRENGVDYPIDYTKADFAEEIKKISPEGVDIILDALNGEATIKGYNILKPFGKICSFGNFGI